MSGLERRCVADARCRETTSSWCSSSALTFLPGITEPPPTLLGWRLFLYPTNSNTPKKQN
jgi:hypothetical protein